MFWGANCLSICLSVCFWCLDYSRINEQIFIKIFLWIGPGQRKKLLKERSGSYMDTKIQEFSEVPFQCIFNEFGFLFDISSKINLHVWFYVIVFLTILYITLETGHIESSVLLSLSASCCFWCESIPRNHTFVQAQIKIYCSPCANKLG